MPVQEPRYQLEDLGGGLWGARCLACGMSVVRSGLRDALYWIKVHEDVAHAGLRISGQGAGTAPAER